MRLVIALLLSAVCLTTGEAQAQITPALPTACKTLAGCLAEVRDPAQRIMHVDSDMDERMVEFGDAAVDALVPMLSDPDAETRYRAGYLLSRFRKIDPKHFGSLAAAWSLGRTTGSGWLPRAVAATGTDEAVALLWQDYLRDPQKSSNAQVFFAFADLGGERIRPLVLERFAQCRASVSGDECAGLYSILDELRPAFPPWGVEAVVDLAQNARSDDVRNGAEGRLVRLKHPAGLAPSQRRLAAFPLDSALGSGEWDARGLIDAVAVYGPAGQSSGPAIVRFLDKRFDEDLRADAALALGRVEDRSAIPALVALEPELADDWVLGYNVAESLGRMRAEEARPLLERLARGHWHRGVRNNAMRALTMLAGGAFMRPGVPGDGAPYRGATDEEGEPYLYFGDLRWDGDDPSSSCVRTDDERRLEQYPAGAMRWPSRNAVKLAIAEADPAIQSEVRRRIPVEMVQGYAMAVYPLASGELVAFNGGEFGGGIFHLAERGKAKQLSREPVDAVWRMGGRVYVVAGLSHLLLDYGHIYVIDPAGPRIERTIRMPASVYRLTALSDHVVVLETRDGDLALREDGTLVDAALATDCDAK